MDRKCEFGAETLPGASGPGSLTVAMVIKQKQLINQLLLGVIKQHVSRFLMLNVTIRHRNNDKEKKMRANFVQQC